MGKRSETTKLTRRVRKTNTVRKTATAMPVALGEPPEVERMPEAEGFPADDSDLAHLLSTPEWEVIGALEALFEAATESITIYDLEGRIVRANAAFYAAVARLFPGDLPVNLRDRLARHPPRNPQGEILAEEEWPQTRLLHGETLSGSSAAATMTYTDGGEAVHWSVTGAPLRAPDGRIIGAVAIHRDITEQKRLERELRQSRDEAQAILDAVPDQVVVYDSNLRLMRSNAAHRAAEQRYYPGEPAPDELPERIERTRTVFRDLSGAELPQGDWPQQRILRGETLSGASAVETQAYTIAGEAQWWTISGAPLRAEDGTITGAVLVNTDITRRKELEDALRASERRLRAALEVLPVGLAFVDAEGKAIVINQAVKTIWGEDVHIAQSRAEYGKYKAWWPQSGKRVKTQEWGLTRALTTGRPQPTDELEIETFAGERKTILLANAPILDDSGAIAGGVSVMVDITERRQLEDELRHSRDELEQRVRERTRELEAANEELARLSHSITRGGVAWALREWQSDLDEVNASVEAEIYACATELVVAWLQSAQTFDGLLEAYFHPDLELTRLIAELCTEGEILLRPHLLLGAACALRLRQIVATIGV
jgi:PAS domain S-box-containing protein